VTHLVVFYSFVSQTTAVQRPTQHFNVT